MNIFKISLHKNLTLSQSEQRLILTQVQSVYGDHINNLEIILSQNEQIIKSSPETLKEPVRNEPQIFAGIWGKIRQGLIDYYGSGGNAMDSVWFSKLVPQVDSEARELTLKAPTNFIKDWVESNYYHLINNICLMQNYNLIGVSI